MNRKKTFPAAFLLVVAMFIPVAYAKPAAVLLQEGLYAEEVDGNPSAAVKIYQQIIADESAQKTQKAQATYRLGNCYLKLKDEQQAKATFQTLLAQYGDQTQLVEKVKPLLDELSNADPAALMPAETLVYVELGSPGRQIETILNMLKGTPFENPLAAMGGGMGQSKGWSGEKGGPDILGALLNPSMMAEFKKIRGMGVGVTGISQDTPPMLVVLFPGKSDALRGIILAALGMMGRPVESIEGMQTLALADMAHAAYDDTVVIASISKKNSMAQLTSAIKQYKGTSAGPTLASHNKSFAKINKKDRQQNLFTIWANVDQVYAELVKQFPDGKLPDEIRIAQGLFDFANIDDVVAFLSLEEHAITDQWEVSFKDGHHCLVYDLIRTPNITKAGFEAVPSDAIALVSFALGDAESAQAKAAGQKIQHLTGLDIGREIFGNIEQVTLFAVPPAKAAPATTGLPPIANCFGLSVTSHDPQKTRQILTTLLSTANLITGNPQQAGSQTPAGKYQIGLVNDQKLYCYLNQVSKATTLSLNPDIIEASINAGKTGKSICQAGPLHEAISKLSPTTSKLVLINVGGAIPLAASLINMPSQDPNQNAQQLLAELAEAYGDKNFWQFSTDEKINSVTYRHTVTGLPPANKVVPAIMKLTEMMKQAKTEKKRQQRKASAPADIAKASQPPVIDGQTEELWSCAKDYQIKNAMYSSLSGAGDCEGHFKAMWDPDNLYLLVEVADDSLINDGGDWYKNDGIEIYIDSDNSKSESYGNNDFQFHLDWDKNRPTMAEMKHNATQGVQYTMITTQTGYRAELKIPWSTLQAKASAGMVIGFDVHVNDDDNGGDRESKLLWYGKEDDAWTNPQAFGNAQLTSLIGWWKFDETNGATAADSSGNGNDGKLQGNPRWQPSGGKIGGALEFDGVDDFVETNFTTDFPKWTVAVWVKSPAAPSTDGQSGPVHREKNFQINWNHLTDDFRGAAGICIEDEWYAASFGNLQANTWYHLVATYDGENLKAYKNGTLITDNSDPSGNPDAESASLKFGKHAVDEGCFGGTIDEVRIYNWAMSPAEIRAIAGLQASGPIGWWKFEGNINDSAGSSNGTEHNGPTYQTGKDGQAISFDGVDDYVTIPDSPAIEFGNQSFSIALWLKSNWKADSEKEFIICNGTNGTEYTGASGKRYVIKFEATNFQLLIDDDEAKSVLNGQCENFATGDWVHAVAVRDTEAQELRIYRNGVLESTETNIDTEDIASPGEPLFIGAKPQEGANAGSQSKAPIDHHYKGMLDDLRIYDYALSQEEIGQLCRIASIKP